MTFIQKNKEINLLKNHNFLRDYRVYVTYLSVFFLALTSGVNIGWTSPMIMKLNGTDDNPLGRILTVDESSWVASIPILGTIAGSLIYGVLGQKFGRKILITSIGIPFTIFYLVMPFAKEIWMYYVMRFLGGISGGGVLTILPTYIGELAKPEIRGKLFVLISIATDLGTLITYSTAPFVPFFWYHLSCAILPIMFLILFPIFALESPYYTIQIDPARAEETLKQLRKKNDVTEEIDRIKMGLQKSMGMSLKNVLQTRATRKALLISMGLATFFMLTGIMIVMTYTQFIFDCAGGGWSPKVNTIVLSVFKLCATYVSSIMTDRYGRKTLLAVSVGVASLSEGTLACYLMLKDNGTDMNGVIKWLPILSLMVFVAASSFTGMAPMISGELFSLRAKNVGMTVSTVYGGLLGFLSTFLFQRIQSAIGLGQSFLIFALFGACEVIFILTIMIETRGKSLDQIQDELGEIKRKRCDEKL